MATDVAVDFRTSPVATMQRSWAGPGHNQHQDQGPRLCYDTLQPPCRAGRALQRASLSPQEKNEILRKTRARNRLAQRRHRQKAKSLSSISNAQNQGFTGNDSENNSSHHGISQGDRLNQDYSNEISKCCPTMSLKVSPRVADVQSLSTSIWTSPSSFVYNYDINPPLGFNNVNNSPAATLIEASRKTNENVTPYLDRHETGQIEDPPIVFITSSNSHRSSTSRCPPQSISAIPAFNSHYRNALLSPPLYLPLPNQAPTSTQADMVSFPDYAVKPATPISRVGGLRRNSQDDQIYRLERVLNAIDDVGFDSVDSMIAAYYTSVFPAGSPMRATQSLSKRRHLKRLLMTLHQSAKGWDEQDAQNLYECTMRNAESILIDEMRSLSLGMIKVEGKDEIFQRLESVFAGIQGIEVLRESKRLFKGRAIETWSLLTELANALNIRPADNTNIVTAFLCMLTAN